MLKLLFLFLNGAKLGKLLLSGGSMLLSVFAYAWIFGWQYATGFVVLIFVHEMGHYIAAKQKKLSVGLPTFIPFVGAWIALKEQPMNVETEAYIAIAGPLAGTAAAIVLYYYAQVDNHALIYALAYAGFFINLFNMLPLSPLDGGRITAALSPKIWILGMGLLIALFIYRPSPILILIALFAFPQVWKVWKNRSLTDADEKYYQLSTITRLEYGLLYLGLTAYLAMMTYETYERLQTVMPR